MLNNKGKLIVIDGTDGSGKATQTKLLVERLKNAGYAVEVADFPQYGKKSAGLSENYLNGIYGTAEEVGPYRASIFYACDRYDASFSIKKWLEQGKIVISNRYVTASMAHQGGKIKDQEERKKFFEWLDNLEYEIFGIPRPDLNIILHVDAGIAQKLVDRKGSREYVGGIKRDIHEADLDHLKKTEIVFREITNMFPDFSLIECVSNGQIMDRETISGFIWERVGKLLEKNEPEKILNIVPEITDSKNFWETVLDSEKNKNNLSQKNTKSASVPERISYSDNKLDDFRRQMEYEKLRIDFKENYLNGRKISNPLSASSKSIKIERLSSQAKLPVKEHPLNSGLDIYSSDFYSFTHGEIITIKTGIKIAIPAGYVGMIFEKNGLAKHGLKILGGMLDSGFTGEITVNMINLSHDLVHIANGQKVAQIIFMKIEPAIPHEGKI